MKVLIIGGTGNLARGIIKSLKVRGASISCLHRGKTKIPENDIETIKGSIDDDVTLQNIFKENTFDVVIDLIGTIPLHARLLAKACEGKVKQIIYSSSVSTYGNEFPGRAILPTDIQKPTTDFAKNKLASEKILFEGALDKKYDLTIMRLSNIYGYDRIMPCNISFKTVAWDRLLNNHPILCSGDGLGLTNLTHIDDAGRAFAYAGLNSNCYQKAYHVVTDKCLTWGQYYHEIAKGLEKNPKILYVSKFEIQKSSGNRYDDSLGETTGFHQFYDSSSVYRDIPEFQQTISIQEGTKQVILNADQKGRLPKWDSDIAYNKIVQEYTERFA